MRIGQKSGLDFIRCYSCTPATFIAVLEPVGYLFYLLFLVQNDYMVKGGKCTFIAEASLLCFHFCGPVSYLLNVYHFQPPQTNDDRSEKTHLLHFPFN
jgi:hypothetical protein